MGRPTISDKLGAIGDIQLVIDREGLGSDDLCVVAGDNLFSQPLEGFAEFAKNHAATLATYDVGDLEAIKKYNNLTLERERADSGIRREAGEPNGDDHRNRAVLLRGVDGADV